MAEKEQTARLKRYRSADQKAWLGLVMGSIVSLGVVGLAIYLAYSEQPDGIADVIQPFAVIIGILVIGKYVFPKIFQKGQNNAR